MDIPSLICKVTFKPTILIQFFSLKRNQGSYIISQFFYIKPYIIYFVNKYVYAAKILAYGTWNPISLFIILPKHNWWFKVELDFNIDERIRTIPMLTRIFRYAFSRMLGEYIFRLNAFSFKNSSWKSENRSNEMLLTFYGIRAPILARER